MQSIGVEVRADAREIEWCSQKCFTHADAELVVVARIALGVGIAIRLKSVTAIGEARGQYGPVIESLPVEHQFFVEHMDRVALPGIEYKIDDASKDPCESHNHGVTESCIAAGEKQRAIDHQRNIAGDTIGRAGDTLGGVTRSLSLIQGRQEW